jgi:hypothetical protein
MFIEAQGTIFAGKAGGSCSSATFPLACVCRGGRWLCAFRGAPEKVPNRDQRVMLTWSDDCGATWREPFAPFTPPEVDGVPGDFRFAGLTRLHGGRILAVINWVDCEQPDRPYFNETTEGLLDTYVFLAHSDDEGETWSTPQQIDTAPFNVPTPLTGPIVRFPDDELACQIELNKPYEDPEPWHHVSAMLFSTDGGETWPRHSVVTKDPENRIFYWDQRTSLLPDGRLFDAFWTYDRESAAYLNIHTRFSSDRGRTWSPLHDTGVPGQPGPVFALEDGELVMPVVDRTGAPKVTVRRSEDNGVTWPDEDVVVVYDAAGPTQTEDKHSMQDAWAEMYAFSVGLPSVAPLPGGGGLLVYYAGPETNQTGIHWAKIE